MNKELSRELRKTEKKFNDLVSRIDALSERADMMKQRIDEIRNIGYNNIKNDI